MGAVPRRARVLAPRRSTVTAARRRRAALDLRPPQPYAGGARRYARRGPRRPSGARTGGRWTPTRCSSICPEHAALFADAGWTQGRRAHGDLRGRPAARRASCAAARRRRTCSPPTPTATASTSGRRRSGSCSSWRAARPAASPPSSGRASAWARPCITREVDVRLREPARRCARGELDPLAAAPGRPARAARRAARHLARTAAPSSSTASRSCSANTERADPALRQAAVLAPRAGGGRSSEVAIHGDLAVEGLAD